MSSNDITVAEYAGVVVDSYCEIAATALIIYESMIITGQEARYFWSERLTGAVVLFYLNKYLTLFSFVYTMIGFVPGMSQQSCTAVVQSTYVIEILVYFPWAAFSGLRAFALSRIWALALFIFCISLVLIAVNWANFWYGVNGVNVPLLGCVSNVLTPTEITRKFTIASRVSLIVADCLLILITWFSISSPQHVQMRKNTFATVLLRDGLIYFV